MIPSMPTGLQRDNRRLLAKLCVVAAAMFGFGYALVPMYRAICEALGINVLSLSEILTSSGAAGTRARVVSTQVDRTRSVTIEFDANARGPWDFTPAQRSIEVHPGELATVIYEFRNPQDHAMAAQAIPSYAPAQASAYFTKVECFCFQQHVLQPGERRRWPVSFYVDPKLPKGITTITLSYTFFEVGGKLPAAARPAAVAPAAGARS
jgi:cytochrome c oxidase assembly protein subunit 11